MSQINLFTNEIEEEIIPIEPEEDPETPPPIPQHHKSKKRKDFEIGKCKRCGQLLLDDPGNTRIKYDDELCGACDTKLSVNYDKYLNKPLIRALRIHKLINR